MQFRKTLETTTEKIKSVACAVLIMLSVGQVFAQNTGNNQILALKKGRISLKKSEAYYLADVLDMRAGGSAIIGNVYVYGKSVNLLAPKTINAALYGHWNHSLQDPQENALPLEVLIDDFIVVERRIAPNKISGEMRVKLTFQWTRSGKKLFLTNYSTATTYTRPEQGFDHEAVVRRLVDGGLRHFDQWMSINDGKNPLLARNVELIFEEDLHSNQKDTVFYDPGKKLTWYDFQGNDSRRSGKYAAAVFSSMAYEGNSRMGSAGIQVTIALKIFMVRSMSWGRAEARNAYTLAHEQTHFDITRIVAQRFKERLKKLDLSIEDYDSQIQYEFLEAFKEMNEEQEAYDGETRHGLDTAAQAAWNQKISAEISRIYKGS